MGLQSGAQLRKVDGTVAFVNLHRISAAEGDVGSPQSSQVKEVVVGARPAPLPGPPGGDFRAVVVPDIEGKQRLPDSIPSPNQELQCLRCLDGSY